MKNILKKAFYIFFAIAMLIMSVPALAFEEGEIPTPAGTPDVSIADGGVYSVDAGKVNRIKVKIRNTSSNTAYDVSILPQYVDIDNTPFTIQFAENMNRTFNLHTLGDRTLEFDVDVPEIAPAKNYEIELKMSFSNSDKVRTELSRKIVIRVVNSKASYSYNLENYVSNPTSIEAGGNGTIGATLSNNSGIDMMDVEIKLNGLTTEAISVNGSDTMKFPKIPKGAKQDFSFNIYASGVLAYGNYPVSYKVTYKNEAGVSFENEFSYFVSVGGAGGTGVIEIINMSEPKGIYGVNNNFTVTFDVINTGKSEAQNVIVKAAEETGEIVPKSLSKVSVGSLKPEEAKSLSFTFAATEAAKSQSYAIAFTVEYDKGGAVESFSQYAGVSVENGDQGKSIPKIIVSKYECDPIIVQAGSEFDLNLELLNTSSDKTVKNVKMYLTLSEETSSETAKTGNIFTPVNSSNTFYFDSMPPKGKAQKTIRLYTVPDAQPKTYTLTVNFEYEDSQGEQYTPKELLGINVKQPTKIEIGEVFLPESLEVGMPTNISYEIYNTGNVTVNNLMVKLDGDIDTSSKSSYYGSFDKGNTEYYDNSFSIVNEGTNNVKMTISYDDPSGERIEDVREYKIEGTPAMMGMEGMDGMAIGPDGMPIDGMGIDGMDMYGMEKPGMGIGAKIGIGVLVVVIIIVIVVVVKKKKKKSKLYDDED